ncbi:MAG: sel1 repeat family protein, partial [Burkholderiales bacterium]|nr:sel1 repeat family protein [Burkholderiales bacterium]
GDVEAAFNLGNILATGRDDYPKDIPRALHWYQRAAEVGYASAQYNLGSLYVQGLDVEKNTERAAMWFSKAAAQNHAKAQMDFGTMLLQGFGVERQFARGLKLLRMASAQPQTASEATRRAAVACAETREAVEVKLCTET